MWWLKLPDPKGKKEVVTNRCFITFMAIDETGYPVKVPAYQPESERRQIIRRSCH